jgi:hypothetical protein
VFYGAHRALVDAEVLLFLLTRPGPAERPILSHLLERSGRTTYCGWAHRGLAWVNDRYAKDATLYRLQDEARAAGRGLWTDSNPVAPWAWRAVHRGAAK